MSAGAKSMIFKCYGFSDADFLELEEDLRKTDIGKMGLYEYLDYSTRR